MVQRPFTARACGDGDSSYAVMGDRITSIVANCLRLSIVGGPNCHSRAKRGYEPGDGDIPGLIVEASLYLRPDRNYCYRIIVAVQ